MHLNHKSAFLHKRGLSCSSTDLLGRASDKEMEVGRNSILARCCEAQYNSIPTTIWTREATRKPRNTNHKVYPFQVVRNGENPKSLVSQISSWTLKRGSGAWQKPMIRVLRPPLFRLSEDVNVSPSVSGSITVRVILKTGWPKSIPTFIWAHDWSIIRLSKLG